MNAVPDAWRRGVVVLGYPSRKDGRPHVIQRWRVRAGVRVFREYGADLMVLCGGAVRRSVPEAEVMRDLAIEAGLDPAVLVVEGASRTTWENVKYAAPLLEHCEVVLLVSDPMHAARARKYWCRQFPADAERVVVAKTHRELRDWWLTIPGTLYELSMIVHDRLRFGA
jgi:uncharacterized SAM-binding protein YcdF (DUF218 family)